MPRKDRRSQRGPYGSGGKGHRRRGNDEDEEDYLYNDSVQAGGDDDEEIKPFTLPTFNESSLSKFSFSIPSAQTPPSNPITQKMFETPGSTSKLGPEGILPSFSSPRFTLDDLLPPTPPKASKSNDSKEVFGTLKVVPDSQVWLQLLATHPILSRDDIDDLNANFTGTPSKRASVLARSLMSNPHQENISKRARKPTISHRLMSVRDSGPTELLVCLNPSEENISTAAPQRTTDEEKQIGEDDPAIIRRPVIRAMSLREWKKACARWMRRSLGEEYDMQRIQEGGEEVEVEVDRELVDDVEFKELNTPQIDFPIRQVQLNGTGRLLAVAGDHDVSVVVVPTYLGRPSGPGRSVSECKYCRIGEYIHSTDRVTRIAKIAWHPLSENQSHLVVLSSDGALRMYNVVLMPDEPEFEYFTVPPARASRASMLGTSYGLGFEEREAISFSLGSCGGGLPGTNLADSDAGQGMGEVGWGPFTIYVLMKNGDVYCVCPVMPNRSLLDMRFLEQLRKINTYEWSAMEHEHLPASSSRSHNEDTPQQQLSNQYYWRNRFLTEIIEMANLPESRFSNKTFAPSSPLPSRRSGMVSAYPPRSVAKLGVKRQGPYLVHPAPDDEDEIACDLVCVYSKPVHLLVVGYEGGVLRVLVEVDPPVPMWDLSVNGEQGKTFELQAFPTFELIEMIDLNPPKLESENVDTNQPTKAGRSGMNPLLTSSPAKLAAAASPSAGRRRGLSGAPPPTQDMSNPASPSSNATPPPAQRSKPNRSVGSVLLVTDPKYVDVLYSYSDRGAYRIDVGPAVSDLVKGAKEPKGSDVTWLVDTHPLQNSDGENQSAAAVTGLALITDMFLGYTQLTLTSNNRIFGNPLPLRIRDASSASSGAVLETAPAADASSSAQSADSEQRILKTAFAEPEILRKGLPTLPKIVAQGGAAGVYPNFVTEEALRVFGKRVMLLRENAQQLINAGMLMSKHVTTQQSELARQALVMQRAHERLETHVTSRGDSLKERLERVVATQKRLSSRSDTVLQILLDLSTPSLSTAEVKWIEEVEGLEKVANERFKPLIAQLTKQHQTLQKDKEKMHGNGDSYAKGKGPARSSPGRSGGLGTGAVLGVVQTRKIKDALRMEYDLLIETTKKLEKVQLGVEEATLMVARVTEASGSDVVSALKEG